MRIYLYHLSQIEREGTQRPTHVLKYQENFSRQFSLASDDPPRTKDSDFTGYLLLGIELIFNLFWEEKSALNAIKQTQAKR